MTDFQDALDEAGCVLEDRDPGTVQLSIAPGVDVRANVGQFRRQRAMEGTGYEWIEFGQIVVRRAALLAAGVTAKLDSGQLVTTGGTKYRVKFCAPDSTGYTLDCVNLY